MDRYILSFQKFTTFPSFVSALVHITGNKFENQFEICVCIDIATLENALLDSIEHIIPASGGTEWNIQENIQELFIHYSLNTVYVTVLF